MKIQNTNYSFYFLIFSTCDFISAIPAISQAAQLSGYTNMSHFSKSFVKKFGVLPKDY
jgi:AraC-like DNA-binding protein